MEDFEHLDFYTLLGLTRTATADEIKRAYRQQISRYHPDRFVTAAPAEQVYASARAQRINEAYRVLGDFNARSAYNRQLTSSAARVEMPPASPPARPTSARSAAPRESDRVAGLYAQAQAEIAAGNDAAAAATLRQLQGLNPFYRDSSSMLEQVEARLQAAAAQPVAHRSGVSRRVLIVGGVGGAILAGLAALGLSRRGPAGSAEATPAPTEVVGIIVTTVGTPAPASSTPVPAPVASATVQAEASATTLPSAVPTASPTNAPSATPQPSPTLEPAEQGVVVLADTFSPGSGWAQVANTGWSVGYTDGAYQITADEGVGNIWSYRTSPVGADLTLGVDVEVSGGVAGLLLRYIDGDSYLAFTIDPSAQRIFLDEKNGGRLRTVLDATGSAIRTAPDAINRLVARLSGPRIELFVNDQPVGTIDLADFAAADRYGLVAAGRGNRAVAIFRNLQIRQL
ncbi:DnaJ domain-containing protein [Candidatus Gracilibacteria bacterium]|nr:DnaJ domain-containing protein [Candidatus Gracilibacteria bacterium]